MKIKKVIVPFMAAVLAVGLLAGCSNQDNATTAAQTTVAVETQVTTEDNEGTDILVFTDMAGRKVELTLPVTKVVALTASDCEIIYALGAEDLLVGRGEYCDYPEDVYNVEAVQSGGETNIEQIIALEPEVLIMATMAQTEEQVNALEEAGIKVVVSDAQDIEGVYDAITMIGDVVDKADEAKALVEEMKAGFEEISAVAENNTGKSVYFEVSPLEWGLWTAGTGTFMDEIANMLGLTNIFNDVEGWAEVSEEQVIERNPDYIVTITMYYGEGPTPEEEISAREGWSNISAVANGKILNLKNNELSRPAPRLVDGAKALYDMVTAE